VEYVEGRLACAAARLLKRLVRVGA
jgi:hypothetical protein